MFHLKKLPKPRPFKECHLKRMAHIGYIMVHKTFITGSEVEEKIVLECLMNGHWYGFGIGNGMTNQWWPMAWYSATTKEEVENDIFTQEYSNGNKSIYKYEFFDTFEEFNQKHGDLVRQRVLTKAPNDFSGGDFAFVEDFPEVWKRYLRDGWTEEEILELEYPAKMMEGFKEYLHG